MKKWTLLNCTFDDFDSADFPCNLQIFPGLICYGTLLWQRRDVSHSLVAANCVPEATQALGAQSVFIGRLGGFFFQGQVANQRSSWAGGAFNNT